MERLLKSRSSRAKSDANCFLSVSGHNKFLYPDENKPAILRSGAVVHRMPWIKMNGLLAFSAKVEDIVYDTTIKCKNIIVWSDPDNILPKV